MTENLFTEFDLDRRLLMALQVAGYLQPTAIQAKAIPPALEGRDILGSSPTGTGKTVAFLLPVLQHLLDFPRKKEGPPRILILTPTRELAMQVADQALQLAAHTSIKIATITGGVAYMNHAEIFSENQDIVVCTTGRLRQYIKEGNFACEAVETLILDEADRMLDMGFAADVQEIADATRWRKQTLLFSATLEGEAIQKFADNLLTDPLYIDAQPSRRERKKIVQWYYLADNLEHKTALLCHLLKQPEVTRAIVFVRKRERVREVAGWLQSAGIKAGYLEGEMAQSQRNTAIQRLSDGHVQVLVATDVAARGLDIMDISHVINFDLPRTADIYLHRIGRTARAGKKGSAIALIEAHDFPLLGKISRYLNEPLKARIIDSLRPVNKTPSLVKNKKPTNKADTKKKPATQSEIKKKTKIRHRDSKNIGKRRQPTQRGSESDQKNNVS